MSVIEPAAGEGGVVLPPAGSIGLVKVEGVVGEAIRVAQALIGDGFQDYEHAFVLYQKLGGDAFSSSQIVEAEAGGTRLASLSEYRGRRVLWLPCPPELSAAMIAAAMTYVGVPYSYTDYAAIATHHLRLPGADDLKYLVNASHHVICSQLAAACADKAGWGLVADEWPGYVTPGSLAKLVPAGEQPVLIQ